MIRVKLNSSKNIGTIYHFTCTLDRLSAILRSEKILSEKSTLGKPLVCMGRSAPEIYLKRHLHDWNYGVMLDGSVLSESYAFRSYETYEYGSQDILIILRKYSNGRKTYFTVQCGDEKPFSVGVNTAKELYAFAEMLRSVPEHFYKEDFPDREKTESWIFNPEDNVDVVDEYPSVTVDGTPVPMVNGLVITGEFTFEELPKGIQRIVVKSGYEAEERIWLATRRRKSLYAGKDDIKIADTPFVDIGKAIQGVVLPFSEKKKEEVQEFFAKYASMFKKTEQGYTSGKWKIRWYKD